MKKYLNLSIVATFVLSALSYNAAWAKNNQSSAKSTNISTNKTNEDMRIFVSNQQRSLYQIALLSGISVTELRVINKGEYDNKDIVNMGDSILLPANSPLLPKEVKKDDESAKENKYNLPSLGSSDNIDVNATDDTMERHVATVLQTLGQQDWDNMTSDKLKEDLNNKTQDYAENYVRNQVQNQVIDPIRSAAQDFLGRFGTAQLQFDVSDQAKLNNVNVKLFSPWYDSENTLIFSQLTYQEYEKDRRIGNIGIGQRWDVADKSWLLGYNVFFDHDFSRNHNRLGLGLEAWSDYMKFAANYYTPLSDWKDSKDFDDYLERAARGFDVRFQGYLPAYPHLGASLMFEQYYGDKVALFGKDNLQKDPYAVTVGVDYTPVPLFTVKGEHKQGEASNKQAKVELTMNYRIGVPLKDQLDPDMVQVARSLKGSRYDLVDRNNYIVLEYKEKKFSVDLASLGEYEEQTIVPITIAVHNAKGTISSIDWNNATGQMDLLALTQSGIMNGGDLCYNRGSAMAGIPCPTGNAWNQSSGMATSDISNWTIRVPDYIDPTTGQRNPSSLSGVSIAGRYTIDVTLTDGNGRTATSNKSWLSIKPSTALRQVLLNNISATPAGGADALGSVTDPAPAGSSVFLQANLTNADPHIPTPVIWSGLSVGSVSGFSDAAIFAYHPATVTTADIVKINELYKATSGGNKVTFVDGVANATCPATTPRCLLVKSINKVAGSATISDDYILELTTSAALGAVGVSLKLDNYAASSPTYNSGSAIATPTIINFSGGIPAKMTITNQSGTVTGVSNNSNVITMNGALSIGDTFTVKIEDSNGTDITTNSVISWSLVGNNAISCGLSHTVLPGDTNPAGDDSAGTLAASTLFTVSNNASYTIPINASSFATTGTSLNGNTMNVIKLGGVSPACAGDQGFKLRLDVQ